jgi:hypothetical protein
MKVRLDFVTNSSSSSFVCAFCGQDVSGWDMCLSEAEMYECENGHTFCKSHVLDDIRKKEWLRRRLNENLEFYDKRSKSALDTWERRQVAQDKKSLADLDGMDEGEIEELAEEWEWGSQLGEEACPICQFHTVTTRDVARYLKKKHGVEDDSLRLNLKEEFGSYKAFREYLTRP